MRDILIYIHRTGEAVADQSYFRDEDKTIIERRLYSTSLYFPSNATLILLSDSKTVVMCIHYCSDQNIDCGYSLAEVIASTFNVSTTLRFLLK